MNMDAKIDALAETCAINGMDKQALGPVGAKLTAGAILALAGGAAGTGMGYMFDRGRQDPDESPSARARKMKQRMLTGAGIGAAAGGLGGLLFGTNKAPELSPDAKATAIRAQLGPNFNGGAAQDATVRELAGQPVNSGFTAQARRALWDARPEFLGGTHMNNAAELAGAAAGPAIYMRGMGGVEGVLRRTGAENVWEGMGGAKLSPRVPIRTFARDVLHMPTSKDYQKVVAEQGITPGMSRLARMQVLRELLRRRNMPRASAGSVALPGAKIPITRSLSAAQKLRLSTGMLGRTEADVISRLAQGSKLTAADMHAMQGWGMNTKTLGTASPSLVIGKRLLPRAILSYYLTRVVNNALVNARTRGMAEDVAKKLVAQ